MCCYCAVWQYVFDLNCGHDFDLSFRFRFVWMRFNGCLKQRESNKKIVLFCCCRSCRFSFSISWSTCLQTGRHTYTHTHTRHAHTQARPKTAATAATYVVQMCSTNEERVYLQVFKCTPNFNGKKWKTQPKNRKTKKQSQNGKQTKAIIKKDAAQHGTEHIAEIVQNNHIKPKQ